MHLFIKPKALRYYLRASSHHRYIRVCVHMYGLVQVFPYYYRYYYNNFKLQKLGCLNYVTCGCIHYRGLEFNISRPLFSKLCRKYNIIRIKEAVSAPPLRCGVGSGRYVKSVVVRRAKWVICVRASAAEEKKRVRFMENCRRRGSGTTNFPQKTKTIRWVHFFFSFCFVFMCLPLLCVRCLIAEKLHFTPLISLMEKSNLNVGGQCVIGLFPDLINNWGFLFIYLLLFFLGLPRGALLI